ncbi:MAG: hypothetical protein IPP35_09340 [Elusimicrobia bacterium]|nr:hypothetical protein [Elusimicrobiota bacterium]
MNTNAENRFFGVHQDIRKVLGVFQAGLLEEEGLLLGSDLPRIPEPAGGVSSGWKGLERYGCLDALPKDPEQVVRGIVRDFFPGAVRWESPQSHFNVGTAVNVAASAVSMLAGATNIYLINDELAGNSILGEKLVANILAKLAGLDPMRTWGIFTFGGTGTHLYGLRIGLRKACPEADKVGMQGNCSVLFAEDSHFGNMRSAEWLGVGKDNMTLIKAQPDRTTDLAELEEKARKVLRDGRRLGCIVLNGGTTYNHTIDPIRRVVELRNQLAKEFSLPYKPHLHVDSVIGWSWLMFRGYDFEANPLDIPTTALEKTKKQYERIRDVGLADSWGVDFHKGVGSCPLPCSIVMINDNNELKHLKRGQAELFAMHQLAYEYSALNPVDYTLETSRASSAPLAALASFHALGQEWYQRHLSNLVHIADCERRAIDQQSDMAVVNHFSDGFATFFRIYPKTLNGKTTFLIENEESHTEAASLTKAMNDYIERFFKWANKNRIGKDGGPLYSKSKCLWVGPSGVGLSALKLYPTSPYIKETDAHRCIEAIRRHKDEFDRLESLGVI